MRCQLTVAFDQGYIDKDEFDETYNLARKVSGIIGNFIKYLRTSRMKGSKFKPKPRKSWAEEWKEILAKNKAIEPLNP